ncbi:branched-chain amino acid ABC transporter permease [Microbacterium sp. QXD-8]|uniref:Branched-chain amino acid ABC transporter permease n=1 Tax=Microbacterium psychrotolerans TaxID=3068321 RepID=A0ABU0Z431_9MICO|nr:branched-chain amino acid ABC transporter permease [Microbacterium sp. QXD-8]MDQ7878564.1 branched-chain amino acid ABC transporter permease [Microbacterium sp. QXD-8]
MTRLLPSLRGVPRVLVFGAVLTLIAIGGTFLLDPYRNFQLATVAAYFCATAGLTLLIGQSGQLSLGQAALMAAGGYGYALTTNAMTDAGITGIPRFLTGMLVAVVVSAALGWLLGLAAARLRGPYLAGVTLTLVIAVPAVAAVFSGVLRGDQGVQIAYDGVPPALDRLIAVEQWQAWVAILVAGVVVTALAAFAGGRLGLRMRAVRDDETAARLNGVRSGGVKVTAFTVSSVAAGAGGAVLCFVTQSVSPGAYTLAFSLLLVVAVVLGGLGSIGGAAIGSALIVLLPWLLGAATAALPLPVEVAQRLSGNLSILVFGVLLIVVMLAWPGGLASLRRRGRSSARNRDRVPSRTPDAQKHALSRSRDAGAPGTDRQPEDAGARHPEPVFSSAPNSPTAPHRKR